MTQGDRSRKFQQALNDLAEASGLPQDDPRLVHASWVTLAQQNLRAAILRGSTVNVGELQHYASLLLELLPKKSMALNVHFVDTCVCPRCAAEFPAPPPPQAVPPKSLPAAAVAQAKPDTPEAAPASEPASQSLENVVALFTGPVATPFDPPNPFRTFDNMQ